MKVATCPVCDSTANLSMVIQSFELFKCGKCGHGFIYSGLKEKDLLKYYNKEYSKDYNSKVGTENYMKRQLQYKIDVDILKRWLDNGKMSVFDFGCSNTNFLKAMPDHWKKYGYEPIPLQRTSEATNSIQLFGSLRGAKKHNYDLITLRGVIEHLINFKQLFNLIQRTITSRGIVYVCATPDFNSPCSKVYNEKWNQIAMPIHYHQFTLASLSILFAKNNFGVKAVCYPYLETPYADFRNDARKFIQNVKGRKIDTDHAYPGTMMNVIFEKIENDE